MLRLVMRKERLEALQGGSCTVLALDLGDGCNVAGAESCCRLNQANKEHQPQKEARRSKVGHRVTL